MENGFRECERLARCFRPVAKNSLRELRTAWWRLAVRDGRVANGAVSAIENRVFKKHVFWHFAKGLYYT